MHDGLPEVFVGGGSVGLESLFGMFLLGFPDQLGELVPFVEGIL